MRDAIFHATGLREATEPVVLALAATFPDGSARCAAALQDVRDDLEVYVAGKTAMDALLVALRREIARA